MQEVLGSDDKKQSSFVSPPIGILTIQILRCHNLIIGDITTSDPFVEIHYQDEVFTTPVIYKTLNPEWEEMYFDLLIYDLENVSLKLVVLDHDFTQEADFLGSLEIKLNRDQIMKLQKKKESFAKNLMNGENGSIEYSLNYTTLSSAMKSTEVSQPQDLLFYLPDEVFQSDMFMSSASTDGPLPHASFPSPQRPIVRTERGLCGVLLISNIELDLNSTTQHHTHQSQSSSSTQSSNSFYVSMTYRDMKKLTGIEKGQREGSHNHLQVSLFGVFPFVILHKNSLEESLSSGQRGDKNIELLDHIIVKVTCKNKFGGKTACEIYLSVSSFLKRNNHYEKELKKNIEIGHLYSGQLTAKIQFIPLLCDSFSFPH
jgi:hypothetical protein